jgi:hypothetical protein
VIRHWNDKTIIEVKIYENSNNSKKLYAERWNDLGMGGDSRIETIYSSTIRNKTGEFE